MANIVRKKNINWGEAKKWAWYGCPLSEIADKCCVSVSTLSRKIEREFDMTAQEWRERCYNQGKAELRKMQWKVAELGDTKMLIFLGKNHLGQSDKQSIEIERGKKPLVMYHIPASGGELTGPQKELPAPPKEIPEYIDMEQETPSKTTKDQQ